MRQLLAALAFAFTAFAAAPALAQPATYTAPFSNVGVGGYDVVAYFTDGRPVRGTTQFRTTHNEIEYRFATAEHLAAFRADPARYLPQYGGYCAWAVGHGYTASANPNNWRIVDGKLYLNYNSDIQRQWDADRASQIRSANANWPSVLSR